MATKLWDSSSMSRGVSCSVDIGRQHAGGLGVPLGLSRSSRVSVSKPWRLTTMAASKTPLKLEKVVLRKSQVEKAKHEMNKFVQRIPGHPDKREHSSPYYLLHNEGESVYGTVVLFHGFSATTNQMSLLAQYLYENGFNVYQPALRGHYFVNPDQHWPKVDFKHDIKEVLVKKLLSDPKLCAYVDNFISISTLTPDQAAGAVDRLKSLDEQELLKAIFDEEFSDSFSKFYESQHMDYLHEAEQRLKEVDALPGPLFTVGLSMGGATALSLAALHSDKVARTAVFAPLLKLFSKLGDNRVIRKLQEIVNQGNCRFSKLAGPLGAKERGWYPDLPFSLSCMVAVDVFGHFVRQEKHLDILAKIPTLIVQTEIDDSADHFVGCGVIKEIEDRTGEDGPPHFSTLYAAAESVPHPMIHPLEASLGHTNKFWQSLYQETFRFLTEGTVDIDHLHEQSQDATLPRVRSLEIAVTVQ